jgi:hypothetical protein
MILKILIDTFKQLVEKMKRYISDILALGGRSLSGSM